jgi:cation diffusion facilitator CzcD-associated flavoprotein CzcO
MPPGMCLKSFGFATSIPTPRGTHALPEYCRARQLEDLDPVEIATFVNYGAWVQKELVPNLEVTNVTNLERQGTEFFVTLETGEQVRAKRVVVATGLKHFEHFPPNLASIPAGFVTHTSRLQDYSKFTGRDVTVIGAGQSALEAAAVLHERGARVRLIARKKVRWAGERYSRNRSLYQRLRHPVNVLGTGWKSWILTHVPGMMHSMPTGPRVRFTRRFLGPLGAWWLRNRVVDRFPVIEHTEIAAAEISNDRVRLQLRSASGKEEVVEADHVVCGTGFEVDLDRLPFLAPTLCAQIARIDKAPSLTNRFESSVRNLYFVGAMAAFSFGPLLRFVAGAEYVTPLLARHMAERRT